jgi:hypothetical protein
LDTINLDEDSRNADWLKGPTHFVAIYGLEIARPVDLSPIGGPLIRPVRDDWRETQKLAGDRHAFHLTAVAEQRGAFDRDLLFDLEGVLTFVQQQWVARSVVVELTGGDTVETTVERMSPQVLHGLDRWTIGSALPSSAVFDLEAFERLILLGLKHLRDAEFDQRTGFRRAFFHNVATHRLVDPLIELIFFLNISAIESLARRALDTTAPDFPRVLATYLKGLGFDVAQYRKGEPHRSTRTYHDIRNELFHWSGLETAVRTPDGHATYDIGTFEGSLRGLTRDVLLRLVGFDDPQMSWDRWLTLR